MVPATQTPPGPGPNVPNAMQYAQDLRPKQAVGTTNDWLRPKPKMTGAGRARKTKAQEPRGGLDGPRAGGTVWMRGQGLGEDCGEGQGPGGWEEARAWVRVGKRRPRAWIAPILILAFCVVL